MPIDGMDEVFRVSEALDEIELYRGLDILAFNANSSGRTVWIKAPDEDAPIRDQVWRTADNMKEVWLDNDVALKWTEQ